MKRIHEKRDEQHGDRSRSKTRDREGQEDRAKRSRSEHELEALPEIEKNSANRVPGTPFRRTTRPDTHHAGRGKEEGGRIQQERRPPALRDGEQDSRKTGADESTDQLGRLEQ